jgi:hypothetical protein
MTAESFTNYKHPKTGKIDPEKSWVRMRKDNHYWDCAVISEAFAEMDKLALAIKPMEENIAGVIASLNMGA